jgi:hypothetical protein
MLSCAVDPGVGRVFRRGLRVRWGKSPCRSVNAQNGGVSMDILVVAIWAVTVALFVLAVYHFTH